MVLSLFCIATRATRFIVGLTNDSPQWIKPGIGNYTQCGSGPAETFKDHNVTCSSNDAYRYVIIQLNKTEYLTFCELEVYGQGETIIICIVKVMQNNH